MANLTLIDGSSYLFRAYHALPSLTNADGEPTGALFGVFNMLRETLAASPDHVAFVADASGPTFRNEMYADYKANRPPMPEDLRSQVEPMLDLVDALGLPVLRVSGVEADDVIGTLACQARAAGMDVTISTSDKDFAQLVGPHITLVNTMTGKHMDADGVIDKFGVPPEQIIDYLALVGDKVDNVPGVNKCGPKTAAKWLAEYGSLDAIMKDADSFAGKIGGYLRDAVPQLPLSRQLVTIKTDVDLDRKPRELKQAAPDTDRLREIYTRYGFKTALAALDNGDAPGKAAVSNDNDAGPEADDKTPEKGEYELVTSKKQLDDWLQKLQAAELIAFDTETTSLDPMRADLVGISLAVEPGRACYIPLAHDYEGVPEQLAADSVLSVLKPILQDPNRPKLAQHGKYDINVLARHGIDVAGLQHDSMLESYVWNATSGRHDMDTLALGYLKIETTPYEAVAGKGAKQIPFSEVPLEIAGEYAAEDADITLRLHKALWPRIESIEKLRQVYQDIEMPLVEVLARMERTGVLVDAEELDRQSETLGERMQAIETEAHELAEESFNLDSTKQLREILFDKLGLSAQVKTPKGAPSTNEEALEAIASEHELPALILEYRSCAKLRSTYTSKLPQMINPDTGRVHTSYHQAVAATGRLSSTHPNLQNIPVRTEAGRRIRKAFIAPDGWRIMAADYSQIELRIMAHLSGDEKLLDAFAHGADIHSATAAEVFGLAADQVDREQRRAAKAINFGLMYGMSAWGLARNLGIGRTEAQDYIDRYFERYPGVHQFMERTRRRARQLGYVETLYGRRLYLNEIGARNQARRAGAERAAINAPMQGTAADIIKRAMLAADAWLSGREDARMLMQVHDELVFEVREDGIEAVRENVSRLMCKAAELSVPLLVDIGVGDNWEQAH
ncbi:MAG: DNA polymerase I [Rhodanobacteraceae bacterium]